MAETKSGEDLSRIHDDAAEIGPERLKRRISIQFPPNYLQLKLKLRNNLGPIPSKYCQPKFTLTCNLSI